MVPIRTVCNRVSRCAIVEGLRATCRHLRFTLKFPYLFSISNFFWNHWDDTSAWGSYHQWYLSAQLSVLSDMKLIRQRYTDYAAFVKTLKHWKYGKVSKSTALSICPCRRIWLPISICLDLSASFTMFKSWNSYGLVLMQLMRGYSLKCT